MMDRELTNILPKAGREPQGSCQVSLRSSRVLKVIQLTKPSEANPCVQVGRHDEEAIDGVSDFGTSGFEV